MTCGREGTLNDLSPKNCSIVDIQTCVKIVHECHEHLAGTIGSGYPFRKALEKKSEEPIPLRRYIGFLELRDDG